MSKSDAGSSSEVDILAVNRGEAGLRAGELSERVIEQIIKDYCGLGDTTIDCGAADGRMTRSMSAAVGPTGLVIAFEPLPTQFEELSREFSPASVVVLNACVGDRADENVTFYHATDRRWISSLSPLGLENTNVEELSVQVKTIDDAFREIAGESDRRRVSLIKLDIEGAEFRAIRGAHATIVEHKPIVVFENGLLSASNRFNYSKEDFFDYFDRIGYRLFDIFGTELKPDIWGDQAAHLAWNFVAVDRSSYPGLEEYCRSVGLSLAQGHLQK